MSCTALKINSGTLPKNLFLSKFNMDRDLLLFAKQLGSTPVKLLEDKSSMMAEIKLEIHSGNAPVKFFLETR